LKNYAAGGFDARLCMPNSNPARHAVSAFFFAKKNGGKREASRRRRFRAMHRKRDPKETF